MLITMLCFASEASYSMSMGSSHCWAKDTQCRDDQDWVLDNNGRLSYANVCVSYLSSARADPKGRSRLARQFCLLHREFIHLIDFSGRDTFRVALSWLI